MANDPWASLTAPSELKSRQPALPGGSRSEYLTTIGCPKARLCSVTYISRAGGACHNPNSDACLNTEKCELNQLAPCSRCNLRATAETGSFSATARGSVSGWRLANSHLFGQTPFATECNVSFCIAYSRASNARDRCS